MPKKFLSLLSITLFFTGACTKDYWLPAQQFQQIASGPLPKTEDDDEVPRKLLVPPDEPVPMRRWGSNREALVCAGFVQIENARRSPVEGEGDPKANTILVPVYTPKGMVVPGAVFLGLGGAFIAGSVIAFTRPSNSSLDSLGNGILGGFAAGIGLPFFAVGLGLTIAGGVKKSPESCHKTYPGRPGFSLAQ